MNLKNKINGVVGIDLGSNTLRACEMLDGEVMRSFEEVVGSARGLSEEGIHEDAKARIREALKNLVAEFGLGKFKNVRYRAVATAAFRHAKNAEAFLDELKSKFGVKFEIISGDEEAQLTLKGVENRATLLELDISHAALVDLGGASTEISYGGVSRSFGFGIISFFETLVECFGGFYELKHLMKAVEQNENLTPEIEVLAARKTERILKRFGKKASEVVKEAAEFLSEFNGDVVVLTSGVPTSVAALKLGMSYKIYDADEVNGSELTLDDFEAALMMLLAFDADFLVGYGRGDLVMSGIFLLCELFKKGLGLKSGTNLKNTKKAKKLPRLVVIDDGLREGVALSIV